MMRFIARIRNSSFTLPLFFFVSALLLNAGNFLNSDEGFVLNGAWKMYNGQKLYADFFSFIPPGSYFFMKWSFDILGPSYWSAKLFSVLFLLASTYALYGTAMLAFAKRTIAVASALLWIFLSFFPVPLIINYNTHSAYAALIAVFFLARAVTHRRPADYFLAGLFAGCTALFLQSKGAFLAAGMGVFLIWLLIRKKEKIPPIIAFIGGSLLLPSIALWAFGWRTLYEQLIAWPKEHYGAVNEVSFVPLLAVLALFFFFARRVYIRRANADMTVFTLVCIAQGALLLSVLHRPDMPHLAWNSFGVLLFGVCALSDIYEYGQSLFARVLRKIADDRALVMAFVFFFIAIPFAMNLLSLTSEMAFRRKVAQAHALPFYAHPFLPGMYLEFGIPDPYPYNVLITGILPREAFESNLAQLEKHDPPYIFTDYGMVAKFHYTADNPLDRYIFSHYVFSEQWGGIVVLKRANP